MLKEYSPAISAFHFAINKAPEMKEAYTNLGMCYIETSNFVRAEEAYSRALKIDDKFLPALIGEIHVRKYLIGAGKAKFAKELPEFKNK